MEAERSKEAEPCGSSALIRMVWVGAMEGQQPPNEMPERVETEGQEESSSRGKAWGDSPPLLFSPPFAAS